MKPPGVVYTFYSYKGGVGRSMALANTAVLMAAQGARVLAIDWDLEAPGLEAYFSSATKLARDPVVTPGVVDLLTSHRDGLMLEWRDAVIECGFPGGTVDLITSGAKAGDYRRRVQSLDWDRLYRDCAIGNQIEQWRGEWVTAYDFVLVDSRTGITDVGDICTALLPDALVLLFVTNRQNLEGVLDAAQRARQIKAELPSSTGKLLCIPIPARDERDHEYETSLEWQSRFAAVFADYYSEWLPRQVTANDALSRLFIPYVAAWSFGERLPVLESERERSDPRSLGAAYMRIARLLTSQVDWNSIDGFAADADRLSARLELARSREQAKEESRRIREQLDALRSRPLDPVLEAEYQRSRDEYQALRRALAGDAELSTSGSVPLWQRILVLIVVAMVLASGVGLISGRDPSSGQPSKILEGLSATAVETRLRYIELARDDGLRWPNSAQYYAPGLIDGLGDADPVVRTACLRALNAFLRAGVIRSTEIAVAFKPRFDLNNAETNLQSRINAIGAFGDTDHRDDYLLGELDEIARADRSTEAKEAASRAATRMRSLP